MKLLIISILLITGFSSCSDSPETGPSEIYYGEDVCIRCKMIISDKKFASQYRNKSGEIYKFDDTGCMFEYIMDENLQPDELEIYVVDHETGRWIEGKQARYVHTEEIKTPMGYGIVAFSDKDAAVEFSKKYESEHIGGIEDLKSFLSHKLGNSE